jgi:hypothetical protein
VTTPAVGLDVGEQCLGRVGLAGVLRDAEVGMRQEAVDADIGFEFGFLASGFLFGPADNEGKGLQELDVVAVATEAAGESPCFGDQFGGGLRGGRRDELPLGVTGGEAPA